jgi:hypothetical protein
VNEEAIAPVGLQRHMKKNIYKEKGMEAKSQSEHNFICVKTSYMFRLHITIIRLNNFIALYYSSSFYGSMFRLMMAI